MYTYVYKINVGNRGKARPTHTRAAARASAYFALPSAFFSVKNGVKHEYNQQLFTKNNKEQHSEQHQLQLFCLSFSAGVAQLSALNAFISIT